MLWSLWLVWYIHPYPSGLLGWLWCMLASVPEWLKASCIYTHWDVHILYDMNMITSSNGKNFRVTGPLCRESGHQLISLTKAGDAELWCSDLHLNKRLSKQTRPRWFDTPSRSLWRHCNDNEMWTWYLEPTSLVVCVGLVNIWLIPRVFIWFALVEGVYYVCA